MSEHDERGKRVCREHLITGSGMISHCLWKCPMCDEFTDIDGDTVVIGDWNPECPGADYDEGKFHCAYGYNTELSTITCVECTRNPKF